MKGYKFFIIILITFSCSKKEQKAVQKEEPLKTIVLKASMVKKEISLPGEIKPFEVVKIFPKVNGFIRSISVDIGSVVRKGQVLLILEAPEMEAQLAEAYSKLQSAKAKFDGSKDTYLRTLASSKTPGIVSPNELEKEKTLMITDSTNFQAATSNYESFKNLSNYLILRSPFDGIITQRNEHPGALVGPSHSIPILELESNNVLRLRVAVPETHLGNVLTDRDIKLKLKSYPGEFFKASLARKSEALNINTRSEIWEFEILNKDKKIKSGMYADVILELQRPRPSFLVPNSSIVTSLEKVFVIRVNQDTLQWVDVEKGISLPDKTEVFGDLHDGDILLKSANEELKQGKKVSYKKE